MTLRGFQRWDGCGFLIAVCFVTCVMLIVNGAVVSTIYPWLLGLANWLAASLPGWLSGTRIAQVFVFALPVFFVVVEWWLYDWFVDRISSRAKRQKSEKTALRDEADK